MLFAGLVLAAALLPNALAPADLILPAAGRDDVNATFVASITITNPSRQPMDFRMSFVRAGEQDGVTISDTLAPGATRVYEDAATRLFHQAGVLGAIRIQANDNLVAFARLNDATIAAIAHDTGLGGGESSLLQDITSDPLHRCTVFIMETSGASSSASIEVLDADGNTAASTEIPLLAFEQRIVALTSIVTSDVAHGSIRVRNAALQGRILAVATLTSDDNRESRVVPTANANLVRSLNGLTGDLSIVGGTNVTVKAGQGSILISSTGGGPAGPQGPEGPNGPQGPKGNTGAVGPRGSTGPAGSQGPTGARGVTGPTGLLGPRGATGFTGPQGATGAHGATGVTGLLGPRGAAGFTGPQGPTGSAGAAGPRGVTGSTGQQGLKGDTGPAGAPGQRGDAGPPGPQGPKGDPGQPGAIGPEGPPGTPGSKGDAGPAGPQGLKGDAGLAGANGPPGPAGELGPKGDAGPAGPQGPKGDSGQPGAIGPQGPPGPAGPQGPEGPPGPEVGSMTKEDNISIELQSDVKTLTEVTFDLDRPRTVFVVGSINILTASDAYIYVYLDDVQAGTPFYLGAHDAWNLIPFTVLRQLPAGHHRASIRGSCQAQNARAGTRVLTLLTFGGS